MTLPKLIKIIIIATMFSDIHKDGRLYESSNHPDSNDESTTGTHENHFSPRSSSSMFTTPDNPTKHLLLEGEYDSVSPSNKR